MRWNLIKRGFSYALPPSASRSSSKIARREKGIWQRRYWEHMIRDDDDMARHVDYVHFNPVKHELVWRVGDWPYSSFHRDVRAELFPEDWAGDVSAAFRRACLRGKRRNALRLLRPTAEARSLRKAHRFHT